MNSPNMEQLLEQQRTELFDDFEKEEPYLFDLYKDINSLYSTETPVTIGVLVREDATSGYSK